jgi:hypothetical protein
MFGAERLYVKKWEDGDLDSLYKLFNQEDNFIKKESWEINLAIQRI